MPYCGADLKLRILMETVIYTHYSYVQYLLNFIIIGSLPTQSWQKKHGNHGNNSMGYAQLKDPIILLPWLLTSGRSVWQPTHTPQSLILVRESLSVLNDKPGAILFAFIPIRKYQNVKDDECIILSMVMQYLFILL